MVLDCSHSLLSTFHFTADTSCVPLYALVQPICRRGDKEARSCQGVVARYSPHCKMQPLGRKRIRPCAMIFTDIHTHDLDAGPDALISVEPLDFHPQPGRWYSVGIHPWSTSDEQLDAAMAAMSKIIQNKQVVALGEVGLDHLRGAPLDIQTHIFEAQLEMALDRQLPVIIHNVKASTELIAIRRRWKERLRSIWIIHGFRQGPELAKQLLNEGFCLSFGAKFNPDALQVVPTDRLYLETDDNPATTISDVRTAVGILKPHYGLTGTEPQFSTRAGQDLAPKRLK